jgi:hypothetical protein
MDMALKSLCHRASNSAKAIKEPVRRLEINRSGAAARGSLLRPSGRGSKIICVWNIAQLSGPSQAFRQLIKARLVALGEHLINWPVARRALTWIVWRGGLRHV